MKTAPLQSRLFLSLLVVKKSQQNPEILWHPVT
jgi:hypothetical protein